MKGDEIALVLIVSQLPRRDLQHCTRYDMRLIDDDKRIATNHRATHSTKFISIVS